MKAGKIGSAGCLKKTESSQEKQKNKTPLEDNNLQILSSQKAKKTQILIEAENRGF